jgi:hypothetical protein
MPRKPKTFGLEMSATTRCVSSQQFMTRQLIQTESHTLIDFDKYT